MTTWAQIFFAFTPHGKFSKEKFMAFWRENKRVPVLKNNSRREHE